MLTDSRRSIAWILTIALPVGTLYGPFLHAHVEEDGNHHHQTEVHAHLSGHERSHQEHHDGITVQEPEHERAIYLQVAVAVATALFDVPVAPPPSFGLGVLAERPAHPAVEVTHGHDPPLVDALDSRPPPSLPVLI
jgi:hypothetical protein